MYDSEYLDEINDLKEELEKYKNAIRKHRDQRGDDRCWMDDEELYKTLPEGYIPPQRDSCVELELCKKFIESRHNPNTTYVSPEREIEQLKSEIYKLKNPVYHYLDLDWAEVNKNHKAGFFRHYLKLWWTCSTMYKTMTRKDQEIIRDWDNDWKKIERRTKI